MCLGIPMKLTEVSGEMGRVEIGGLSKQINLTLLENPKAGCFVLVHAGFALQEVDEDEAKQTLALLNELAELKTDEDGKA